MKGIPLAYNKDMQEDKEAIFDAVDTLELCLKTVTPMLDTMKTLPANMRRAAAKGLSLIHILIKKWSIRYPAVGGEEERRAYVYLPTM